MALMRLLLCERRARLQVSAAHYAVPASCEHFDSGAAWQNPPMVEGVLMRLFRLISSVRALFAGAVLAAAVVQGAQAHHSFAVFFDSQKSITLTGVVTQFSFVNPHGIIRLEVKTPDGKTEEWKIETNAPSVLRRRGWTPESLKVGETVTIEGWPARDDSRYARLRSARRANGEPVGKPFEPEG